MKNLIRNKVKIIKMSAKDCIAFAESQGLLCRELKLPLDYKAASKYVITISNITISNVMLYTTDKRLYRYYSVQNRPKKAEEQEEFLKHLEKIELPNGDRFGAFIGNKSRLHLVDNTEEKLNSFKMFVINSQTKKENKMRLNCKYCKKEAKMDVVGCVICGSRICGDCFKKRKPTACPICERPIIMERVSC
jgi:hypothetical protein